MPKVTISEQGKRTKESKEFGYLVEIDLTGYGNQEYQNRARLMDGQWLLEGRRHPRNNSSQYHQFAIRRKMQEADAILYQEANAVAKKILENLIPELEDYTQMFKASQEKELIPVKKPKKKGKK